MAYKAEKKQERLRRLAFASLPFLIAPLSLPFHDSPQSALRVTIVIGIVLSVVTFFASVKIVKRMIAKEANRAKVIIHSSTPDPLRFEHAVFHQHIKFGRSWLFPFQLIFGGLLVGTIGYYRELPWPLIAASVCLVVIAIFGSPRRFAISEGRLECINQVTKKSEIINLKEVFASKDFVFGGKVLLDHDGKMLFELPGATFKKTILNDYVDNYLIKIS